jgi:hypothetical protein
MFIRFTTTEIDRDSHHPKGVFVAAGELRDSSALPRPLEEHLRSVIRWFNENLDAPDDVDPRSIFWFRASSQQMIHRVWDLVNTLRANGCFVEEVTCHRPGKILFEDDDQVAAIPFRDVAFRR